MGGAIAEVEATTMAGAVATTTGTAIGDASTRSCYPEEPPTGGFFFYTHLGACRIGRTTRSRGNPAVRARLHFRNWATAHREDKLRVATQPVRQERPPKSGVHGGEVDRVYRTRGAA
jgi:hypothetical protein